MASHLRTRLLLFDPYSGGHHAEHIVHLANAWKRREEPGKLVVCVSSRLFEDHPEIETLTHKEDANEIDVVRMAQSSLLENPKSLSLMRKGQLSGLLLTDCIARHNPERVHVMMIDHLQMPLALRIKLPEDVRLSGLLFRPDLHYSELTEEKLTIKQRLNRARKRLVLKRALRHQNLKSVLTLDHTAVPYLSALARDVLVKAVPEPMDMRTTNSDFSWVRPWLGIEEDRLLLLLFGSLDRRKGIFNVLDALNYLDDSTMRQISIAFVGKVIQSDLAEFEQAVRNSEDRDIQIVIRNEFVPNEHIQPLLSATDLVLLPYQGHIGSSGVLVRSAGAETPILAPNYGLMAVQTKEYQLGNTVDVNSPEAIALAIQAFVETPALGFNAESARSFASWNTPEAYANETLDTILA